MALNYGDKKGSMCHTWQTLWVFQVFSRKHNHYKKKTKNIKEDPWQRPQAQHSIKSVNITE